MNLLPTGSIIRFSDVDLRQRARVARTKFLYELGPETGKHDERECHEVVSRTGTRNGQTGKPEGQQRENREQRDVTGIEQATPEQARIGGRRQERLGRHRERVEPESADEPH